MHVYLRGTESPQQEGRGKLADTVEDVNAARAEFARAMDRMQRGGYSINDVLLALVDCLAINIAAVGNLVGADEQQRLIKWAVDALPRMVADRAEVYGSRQRRRSDQLTRDN
jgi:hypothetical protein